MLAEGGPLVVDTGDHTGRSPKDKFIVRERGSEDRIWWGDVNKPLDEENFFGLRDKVVAYLNVQPVLYVVDAFAGADPAQRLGVRVITDRAYHALFAKTMFIEPSDDDLDTFEADALVLHAPALEAEPQEDGTRSGTFVALHPARTEVLIGGTEYAGEIKKSIFTVMNDRLPLEGILPMHCSANVDDDGRVAVFFGLSGTGKTTLSADPERRLIGDDEHGWSDSGVFNIEGGCYAKVIRLSAEAEPEIFETTRTFGTILENVAVDERGVLDLDDASKTENTRAAYKLERISHALPEKRAGHPSSVVMLTADAFGVLPPIARLTHEQALFYFLSGFTAKLAGTEIGVTEPQPTFSTCFGAPFLPQPPGVYARMLGEKLAEHDVTVWLVNTGWTGGPFGEGRRMPIAATRALLYAARSPVRSTASSTASTSSSGSRCRPRCRASTRRCSILARRGAIPRRTTGAPASSRRCSRRTSRSSSTTRRPRSRRPARASSDAASTARSIFGTERNRRIRKLEDVEAKHDVLVVGAGCAGMRAAIEAHDAGADVGVISKLHPTRSHSGAAEGGINAALGNAGEDDPEKHTFDTVKGSDYLGDQDAIEILCREAPGDIYQLEHWGAFFSRRDDGRLAQRPFGAAGSPRTVYAADITGHVLIQVLYEQLCRRDITVYEEFFAWRLVVNDDRCQGVICWDLLDGGLKTIGGKTVVLATGGAGRLYRATTNAYACTGDGMAMALPHGAAAEGHGVHAVPPDDAVPVRDPHHRGLPRRGRVPDQQGRRALHEALRAERDGARVARRRLALGDDRDRGGARRQRLDLPRPAAPRRGADHRPAARLARARDDVRRTSIRSTTRSPSGRARTTTWAASTRTTTASPS